MTMLPRSYLDRQDIYCVLRDALSYETRKAFIQQFWRNPGMHKIVVMEIPMVTVFRYTLLWRMI